MKSNIKTNTQTTTMRLIHVSGSVKHEPINITSDRSYTLGRSSDCDFPLPDNESALSRRHILIEYQNGIWTVMDLHSRNGTKINGIRLKPDVPTPMSHRDTLSLGPCGFMVMIGRDSDSGLIHTTNDIANTGTIIERVPVKEFGSLAKHRLEVLLACAEKIHNGTSMCEIAEVALHAMLESTGYTLAAYLVPAESESIYSPVSIISVDNDDNINAPAFSRSLLQAASEGEVVRLITDKKTNYAQSIMDLSIHSALCVPVCVADVVAGYLYLDARAKDQEVRQDATAFGRAIGRLLGLALANLNRQELERRQQIMQFDLDAAAKAQQLLLPAPQGVVGGIEYSMIMQPGKHVAGDIFGIVELPDEKVCVFLGDVAGKGAGAAMLMATAQSYIQALLHYTNNAADIATRLNQHIAKHTTSGCFITMWIGCIHQRNNMVEFVDAGHGHWLICSKNQNPRQPQYSGGLVIGIDPQYEYQAETFNFNTDDRLVLFSDGVVEQQSLHSIEYSVQQAIELLAACNSSEEDVKNLFADVQRFAESPYLKDDVTIASMHICKKF